MAEKRLEIRIPGDSAGIRLDRCLSRLIPGSSRVYLQKLIRAGAVRCNGVVCTLPRQPVTADMRIELSIPEVEEAPQPAAEKFGFDILYEDEWMLVIDKPAGVVVHPAAGTPDGTVVNALLGRYPRWRDLFGGIGSRPGIVHRLDKDTSGCLVVAKTPDAQYKLGAAFAERRTAKCYLALIKGVPADAAGELRGLIGRHPVNRQKMALLDRGGKPAVTRYRVCGTGRLANTSVALLLVNILTGRTHQIRVHMSSLGCPVLGDELYGGARGLELPVARQQLHAWRLSLPHPADGRIMSFEAPVPDDMLRLVSEAGMVLPGCGWGSAGSC